MQGQKLYEEIRNVREIHTPILNMGGSKNNNSKALLYQLISQLQGIFCLKTSELYQLYSEHLAHSHTVTS